MEVAIALEFNAHEAHLWYFIVAIGLQSHLEEFLTLYNAPALINLLLELCY